MVFSVSWFLLVMFQAFSSAQERQERDLAAREHAAREQAAREHAARELAAQELAALELRRRLNETVSQTSETQDKQKEDKHDEKVVEDMFGFLTNSTESQKEPRQRRSQVTPL